MFGLVRLTGLLRIRLPAGLAAGVVAVLVAGTAAADGAVPGWNKLVYVIYRLEVTNYCGLTTDDVAAGFRLQRKSVLDAHPLDEELVKSAWAEAAKLAYKEWDNRGLGGFRRWCRNDAARYVGEFKRALAAAQPGG